MPTLARRADQAGQLTLNGDDDVARSAAIVHTAGYQLVPLAHAIGPWGLLGTCSQGLLLVSTVRDVWPTTLAGLWGHPASFPVNTRRLIHCWKRRMTARSSPLDGPSPERSGPVGSPQPVCVVCRGPRDYRKREACSDKCRAALSRLRRTQIQTTRDLLEAALEKLQEGVP